MANPLILNPTTRKAKKSTPGLRGLLEILELNALDVWRVHEDFNGAVAAGELDVATDPESLWTKKVNNGGTITFTAGACGLATLDTVGSTANDYAQIYMANTPCSGNRHAVLAVRLYVPTAVTLTKVEVGFADDPANDAGIVNVLATPTFNSTNGVAACYDTNDAGNTTYWQLAGVMAGAAATKIEPTYGPTADVFQTIIVALRDTSAKMMILNEAGAVVSASETAWMASAVTAATLLCPAICVQTRAAANKSILIDCVDVWQRRSTT